MSNETPTKQRAEVRFPMKIKRGFAHVTIYRRKHLKTSSGYVYTVAWTVGGRRYLLQRATLQKAQIEAGMKAEMLGAGKTGAASMTTDDAATLAQARKICSGVPIVTALQEWADARKLCSGSIMPAARLWADRGAPAKGVSVPDAVKAFLKQKKAKGVDVSASYEDILPPLAKSFTGPIASLSADALEAWINETFVVEGKKTIHPGTFNTARKRLVTLWRWARLKRFLPQDVMTEAERIQTHKEEPQKRGILKLTAFAQALQMLRADHPPLLATAVLIGFCGIRRKEIHAQRWEDINLKAETMAVTAAKKGTQSDRIVQLPPAAVEWLLLCDRSSEMVAPTAYAQDKIRKLCREHNPPIECPKNGFRHSFVSFRVARTGDIAETSLEAGNSPSVIVKNYRKPVSKADGEDWATLTPAKAASVGNLVLMSDEKEKAHA